MTIHGEPGTLRRVLTPRRDAGLKDWMTAHNAVIMSVLCLIIATKLVGDAISGLTA